MTRLLVCTDAKLERVGKVREDYSARSDLCLFDISKMSSKIRQDSASTALSLWAAHVVVAVVAAAWTLKIPQWRQRYQKNGFNKSPFQFAAMSFYDLFPGSELVDALINSSLRRPGSQMQVSCFCGLPPGLGLYLWMKLVQWFRACMMISKTTPKTMNWQSRDGSTQHQNFQPQLCTTISVKAPLAFQSDCKV